MQRSALRVTIGGVAVDVPLGTFSAGQNMQYDSVSGTFKGVAGGGGSGDVVGPASSVAGRVASFADATGKLIQDSGKLAADVVTGPASSTSGNIASFNGTGGKVIQDGGKLAADLATGPASAVSGNLPSFNGTGGKALQDSGVAASLINTHASRHNPGGADAMFTGSWSANDSAIWNGTIWVPKAHKVLEVTSNFTGAGTGLTDVTGLSFSLPRAGTYWLDFVLVTSQSISATLAFGVNVSASLTRMAVAVFNPTTTTATTHGVQTANNTATASATRAVTTNFAVTMTGTVTVSGAATLSARAQRSTGTLTVVAGSGGHVREL